MPDYFNPDSVNSQMKADKNVKKEQSDKRKAAENYMFDQHALVSGLN